MLVTSYMYDINQPKGHNNVIGLRSFDVTTTRSRSTVPAADLRAPGDGVGFTAR